MNVLIKSATILDDKSDFHNQTQDILVENGFITQIAKSLKNPRYKQKIVKPKKGKGSFKRNKKTWQMDGKTSAYKKAIITLKEGEVIDIYGNI